MISQKAMKDARLNAARYEQGAVPPQEFAEDATRYLNSIISGIVKAGLVEKGHHIEMAYANLGDTLVVDGEMKSGGWPISLSLPHCCDTCTHSASWKA